jgi:hypothetical protein
MSSEDSLQKRGAALENQFFSEVDKKLTDAIRVKLERADNESALAELSGLKDPGSIAALIEAGVSPTTLPALRLFPLIAVAWADGRLETGERETVLDAASKHGVSHESDSGRLVASWLENKPSDELFAAWEAFAKALISKLPITDALTVQSTIIEEINAVAKASGGLLGWNAISLGENKAMNRIEQALKREG